jgi:hypothetical protein
MAAEMPVERRRPRDEGEAQAVVDHREPAGGQREALAIGAGDHLAAGGRHVGKPVSPDSLAPAASTSRRRSGARAVLREDEHTVTP